MSENRFVHLHVYSTYTPLHAANYPKDYIERASKLGMTAVAVTDRQGMFGAIDHYQTSQQAGIQPIIGLELNIRKPSENRKKTVSYPIVLLVKNFTGYILYY